MASQVRSLEPSRSLGGSQSLPFLPGIRKKESRKERYPKKQIWSSDTNTGTCYEREENPLPVSPIRALRAGLQKDWDSNAADPAAVGIGGPDDFGAPAARSSPSAGADLDQLMATGPSWLSKGNEVLSFFIYFKEPVHESNTESFRLRRCKLLYYLEDNTLQIEEPRVQNSGLPQGAFLKRGAVEKTPGTLYTPTDFLIGAEVAIFGRVFHVYDTDTYTRKYMREKFAVDVGEAESLGDDPYQTMRSPTRKVIESIAGSKRPDTLGPFLRAGRQVLRFQAVWDDATAFGERQFFTIHYFLADDTLEVRQRPQANSGRDPFPLLLSRGRLPKDDEDIRPQVGASSLSKDRFYHYSDLEVGKYIKVFGRELLLMDCDGTTRQWYKDNLATDQGSVARPEVKDNAHAGIFVPPYTGIGSEEDSLASCLHLVPKPVTADLKRFIDGRDDVLRFVAKIAEPQHGDEGRTFVIQYFMVDDTIAVYEPPHRNSGIVGGKFLERGKYKKAKDARNNVARVKGEEGEDAKIKSLQETLVWKINSRTTNGPGGLLRSFKRFGGLGQMMTFKTFKEGCRSVGITNMSEEDMQLLFSSLDKDGSGHMDFQEFVMNVMKDKYSTIPGSEGSRWFRPADFYVGARVDFMFPRTGARTQEFIVVGADKLTQELMAANPDEFPVSDYKVITDHLARVLSEHGLNIRKMFKAMDTSGDGRVSTDDFAELVLKLAVDHGLVAGLPPSEMEKLKAHYDATGDGEIDYEEFLLALHEASRRQGRSHSQASIPGMGGAKKKVITAHYEQIIADKTANAPPAEALARFIKRFASLFFVRKHVLHKRFVSYDVEATGPRMKRRGRIKLADIMDVLVAANDDFSKEDQKFFRDAVMETMGDDNGEVDYEELLRTMFSHDTAALNRVFNGGKGAIGVPGGEAGAAAAVAAGGGAAGGEA